MKSYRISLSVKFCTCLQDGSKITLGWNFAMDRELVTAYRSFLIDRGNFTPEQTFKCDRSLKGLFLLKKNFSLKNKSLETKRLIQVFLQKLRILNIILYKWKFFCTKELLTKFIFGIPERVFSVTFLVQTLSWVVRCLGDNHYQMVFWS